MSNIIKAISQGQNIITYSCSSCMFLKVHGVSDEFRQSSTREPSEWKTTGKDRQAHDCELCDIKCGTQNRESHTPNVWWSQRKIPLRPVKSIPQGGNMTAKEKQKHWKL